MAVVPRSNSNDSLESVGSVRNALSAEQFSTRNTQKSLPKTSKPASAQTHLNPLATRQGSLTPAYQKMRQPFADWFADWLLNCILKSLKVSQGTKALNRAFLQLLGIAVSKTNRFEPNASNFSLPSLPDRQLPQTL